MGISNTLGFILNHPLNQNRRLGALADFLKWQIGSRLVPGEVVHEWVKGVKFYVHPGETGLTGNIYAGLHEFEDMAFILHYADEGDLFVDVGANVGSYTLLACGAKGAKGHAFEPIPSTFRRLLRNLQINGLENRVHALNVGIGNKAGHLKFTADEDCINHVVMGSQEEAIDVKVETLDKILHREKPTLLKIDVEGFEVPVLRGAKEVLRKSSLAAVLIETNGSGNRYGFNDDEIVKLITRNGFSGYAYDPFQRKLLELNGNYPKEGNTLFIRNRKKVEKKLKKAASIEVLGRKF